jgi:hypothetical protein
MSESVEHMHFDVRRLPAKVKRELETARFPDNYIRARKAIHECALVDEVTAWANRSAAMATYAREISDRSMLDDAIRIQARALERLGEMLAEMPGSRDDKRVFAEQHGISSGNFNKATNLVQVPKAVREEMIEGTPPATANKIASEAKPSERFPDQRRTSAEIHADWLRKGFERQLAQDLFSYASNVKMNHIDPIKTARHFNLGHESYSGARATLKESVGIVLEWLDIFEQHLKG